MSQPKAWPDCNREVEKIYGFDLKTTIVVLVGGDHKTHPAALAIQYRQLRVREEFRGGT
jgi:hypothetical protein